MRATGPANFTLPDLITLISATGSQAVKVHYFVIFFILPVTSTCSSQRPDRHHRHSVFFPACQILSFAPTFQNDIVTFGNTNRRG